MALIKKVLILIAMEDEANPIIQEFGLSKSSLKLDDDLSSPCINYHGSFGLLELLLITNGKSEKHNCCNVGTTPAAISAFIGIHTFRPDLIINAGTAGGFSRMGGSIADVYICNQFAHHDRRIPIPGYDEYGRGNHFTLSVDKIVTVLLCFCFLSASCYQ